MIDWSRVQELRDEIGADDFDEVVELFLMEVETVIDKLREAPDPESLEADMHFLKGSALNLGFQALSDLCAQAEQTAASGQTSDVDTKGVLDTYAASRAQFLGQLSERLSA